MRIRNKKARVSFGLSTRAAVACVKSDSADVTALSAASVGDAKDNGADTGGSNADEDA